MTKNTASGAYPWVQHSKKLYNIDLSNKIFIFLLFKNFLWRFFERNWILRRSHRYHYFFATRPIHTKLISFCCRSSEMHRRENESHSTLNKQYGKHIILFISHLIDIVFDLFIWSVQNTQVSLVPIVVFNPRRLQISPMICLSLSVNPFLCLSFSPRPLYPTILLPTTIPQKYIDELKN